MMRVKINPSFYRIMEEVEEGLEEGTKRQLHNIAHDATNMSTPYVDTGAFVTSWSFNVGRGRPRGKSSRNKPKGQNKEAKAAEGLALLKGDLARLDLKNTTAVYLRNGAPHAKYVNSKGPRIIQRLRNKYG